MNKNVGFTFTRSVTTKFQDDGSEKHAYLFYEEKKMP